jgi:LPXTG-motif cell wall-anchored protein
VSWDFAKLENLDQVSFQVRQREEDPVTSDPSSSYLLPVVGVAVVVALAAMLYFMKKK